MVLAFRRERGMQPREKQLAVRPQCLLLAIMQAHHKACTVLPDRNNREGKCWSHLLLLVLLLPFLLPFWGKERTSFLAFFELSVQSAGCLDSC